VTDAGTVSTAGLALDMETVAPPAGAPPFRFTWPVLELLATTEEGAVTDESATGVTDKLYDRELAPYVAVIPATVVDVTEDVEIGNSA